MDNERTIETRKPLPKKAFDSEYMTEFLREVRFLTEKGIAYTFVKKTQDYGVSQYKYRKTPALFAALVEFYSMIEAEKSVRKRRPYVRKDAEDLKKDVLDKAAEQNIPAVETDDTI